MRKELYFFLLKHIAKVDDQYDYRDEFFVFDAGNEYQKKLEDLRKKSEKSDL